ncbi:NAD(P)-dependent dehydrogenase (short-subunit alcohol dehydrogenase family) [Streptosporangium becharense]|uniref:NAD(P)-dependent dehydrogenase (Short-subunit alcohol dehydrogenase family) n=1 Tax=Streptosporangium becharense TaxID=1816182 RepID=A0A7W9ILP9_9ACTN|nr:SDR family oxidoreductase [Streptosporangium becharense]MBB2910269.1 NAD(P)-dependent dehydrogenase (short-subunit alcohol dehydrogenase family) [Streptosporangium becharense]MBB5823012.1 NAD(P)-dependent dehydrogenase (short-subunit alcohol dehydrogenase family) [Streptosporangium becharense]
MMRLTDRRVLITGAASGIGQATALRLLAEGARVVAADVAEDGLEQTLVLATEQGVAERLTVTAVDIADEGSVNSVVSTAVAELGGLDALVNAAAILRGAHTHDCSLELWNRVIAVNLTGTFLMTRAALPALLETGRGVVVNFSSTAAFFAHPFMAAYSASKGGIFSFTHSIAQEYAKQGLRAVNVVPGGISSGITNNIGGLVPADTDWDLFLKLTPALPGGIPGPEKVAGVVAMLVSDDGSFITGTEIRVDGGAHQ